MIRFCSFLFFLLLFVSCGPTRETQFVVKDFSKPYQVIYTGKEAHCDHFVYDVKGIIKGGKIRITDDHRCDSLGICPDDARFYTYSDTVSFVVSLSSYVKNRRTLITILPDSGVTGKVIISFKEYKAPKEMM